VFPEGAAPTDESDLIEATEADAPDAPVAETPPDAADDTGFDPGFKLADVPEDVRPHVERYIESAKPAFSRRMNALAEQERELGEATEIIQGLRSPEQRMEALRRLSQQYDLPLEFPDDGSEEEYEVEPADEFEEFDEEEAGLPVTSDPNVEWLVQREKQREAQEQQAAQEREAARVGDAVTAGLSEFAKAHGMGEDAESLPEPVRNAIVAQAATLPLTKDGLPDMKGAAEAYRAAVALEQQRYLETKPGTAVPGPGPAGEKKLDVRNDKDRLAMAQAAAARHFPEG
jgi:hypothetical protein